MEKQERTRGIVESENIDEIKKVLKHTATMVFIRSNGRNFELFGGRI